MIITALVQAICITQWEKAGEKGLRHTIEGGEEVVWRRVGVMFVHNHQRLCGNTGERSNKQSSGNRGYEGVEQCANITVLEICTGHGKTAGNRNEWESEKWINEMVNYWKELNTKSQESPYIAEVKVYIYVYIKHKFFRDDEEAHRMEFVFSFTGKSLAI